MVENLPSDNTQDVTYLEEQVTETHTAFIGPRSEEQYVAMERSYLSSDLPDWKKEFIHRGVEQHLTKLALARGLDLDNKSYSELYELRRRIMRGRLRRNLRI